MKFTLEKLDLGWLLTAEDGGAIERLAYQTAQEAILAVSRALGINPVPETPRMPPRAPVAPTPAPAYDPMIDGGPDPANEPPPPPPATRRIGLSGASKSPGRPVRAGR